MAPPLLTISLSTIGDPGWLKSAGCSTLSGWAWLEMRYESKSMAPIARVTFHFWNGGSGCPTPRPRPVFDVLEDPKGRRIRRA